MRVFMTMLCSLLTVCSVSAQISRQEGTDGQAAIYRLPLMERAFLCCRYFEGWHSEKHYPYVGWGHKLLPNEKYSARTMTKRDADELLRKDLRKFVAMFRKFGVDSILLGTLAYNVGPAKLLGSKTIPKSTLIKKLEAGDRGPQYRWRRRSRQSDPGGSRGGIPPRFSSRPPYIRAGRSPLPKTGR